MEPIGKYINVKSATETRQVNLYDGCDELDRYKEFTYSGSICYAATTNENKSADYLENYSGWSFNWPNGKTEHVLTNYNIYLNMFNWAQANYATYSGQAYNQVTEFNTDYTPSYARMQHVINARNAFNNCRNLTDITPFENMRAVSYDGNDVSFEGIFRNCVNLEDFNVLETWDTGNVNNMANAFNNCQKLTYTEPFYNWDTSKVTDMAYMFFNCANLQDTSQLSNWDTSKVTNMTYMFGSCVNVTDMSALGLWDVSSMNRFSLIFQGCSSLTDIDFFGSWGLKDGAELDRTFMKCSSIKTVPNITVDNVSLFMTFDSCTNLTGNIFIISPNVTCATDVFNGTSSKEKHIVVNNTGGNAYDMFKSSDMFISDVNNTAHNAYLHPLHPYLYLNVYKKQSFGFTDSSVSTLADLVGGDDVTTVGIFGDPLNANIFINGTQVATNVNYYTQAFNYGDTPSLRIEASGYVSFLYVWNAGDYLKYDWNISETLNEESCALNMANWARANYNSATGINSYTLTSFTCSSALPTDCELGNVTNLANCFNNCVSLTNIAPFANLKVTESGASMYYMMYNCRAISNINALNSWNVYNVSNMEYVFGYCTNITNFNALGNWNTLGATQMSYMFAFCNNVTYARNIYQWKTNNVTSMAYMFYNCANITNANMTTGWNTAALTTTVNMFANCFGLTYVQNLNTINTSKVTNMFGMFYGCNNIVNANMANGWKTNNVTNMAYMFYNCVKVTNFNTLSGLNLASCTNFAYMFRNCTNMTNTYFMNSWNVPDGANMYYMYYNCTNITNVANIYYNSPNLSYAYYNCKNVTGNIWITSPNITCASNMFYNANSKSKDIIANNKGNAWTVVRSAMGSSNTNTYWNATLHPLYPTLSIYVNAYDNSSSTSPNGNEYNTNFYWAGNRTLIKSKSEFLSLEFNYNECAGTSVNIIVNLSGYANQFVTISNMNQSYTNYISFGK